MNSSMHVHEIGSGMEESGEMWIEGEVEMEMDGGVVDDEEKSIFYDEFPSLPDFPCISSASSSSLSTGGGGGGCSSSAASSSSSSTTNSWAIVKVENEDGVEKSQPQDAAVTTVEERIDEGMDVLRDFGDMDLLDSSGMWDPSSLFSIEDEDKTHHQQLMVMDGKDQEKEQWKENEERTRPSEDLAMVFFEWLKSNKESISPEDLRSIKLKRSTIECAASRLGGGKEGMKQLLKLILAWVQNHHLQKKKSKEEEYMSAAATASFQYPQQPFPIQVQIPAATADSSSWMHPNSAYLSDAAAAMQQSPFPHHMMMGFVGGDASFPGGPLNSTTNHNHHHPFSSSSDYHQMIDSNVSWTPHFSFNGPFSDQSAPSFVGFPNKYAAAGQLFQGHHGMLGEPLMKMAPSATKEARKKRMARQRRFFSHHHHHRHHHQNHHQHHPSEMAMDPQQQQHPSRLVGNANCTTTAAQTSSGSWVMWSSSSPPPSSLSPTLLSPDADPTAMQPQQRQISSDRRQGWKPEKNLRFLLQKVLKQSDVGNLGRIVLPKKEAETHLPELEARDGISIAMEDIGTSRIWNMRYRFWPNNKSRMYLLENTGDFVRTNGLQEGDFIVIYSDTKCGKYMIRGVKVRKPESKQEGKSAGKTQRTSSSHAATKGSDGSTSASCNR